MKKIGATSGSLLIALLFASGGAFSGEASDQLNPEVAYALNWTLPENTCEPPKWPAHSQDIVDPEAGTVRRSDIDHYELARLERKEKRWQGCVADYKNSILEDFQRLRESAKHGLTQTQAETIVGKLLEIQNAVESPTGIAE